MSAAVKSTSTPMPATAPSTASGRRNAIILTPEKLTPEKCQTLISSAPVFPARATASAEKEADSMTPEEHSSLKFPDWLKQDNLRIFCLRMWLDCFRMTKAGHFVPSSPRFMTWGMVWNGVCLTAPITGSRNHGEGCSLSDILIHDAPTKYFLSPEQTARLLYKCSEGRRGPVSTTQPE